MSMRIKKSAAKKVVSDDETDAPENIVENEET